MKPPELSTDHAERCCNWMRLEWDYRAGVAQSAFFPCNCVAISAAMSKVRTHLFFFFFTWHCHSDIHLCGSNDSWKFNICRPGHWKKRWNITWTFSRVSAKKQASEHIWKIICLRFQKEVTFWPKLIFFTTVLSQWDFSHGKFGLPSPGESQLQQSRATQLGCVLGVLVFP